MKNWKSAIWDTLIRGDNCPICVTVQSNTQEDQDKIAIFDLELSTLYLIKNQYIPGYCVLLCHRHVIELHELTRSERIHFFEDLALSGQIIQRAFQANKMNYNVLGNVVPHLHVHIIPRYFTDPSPHRPIDPTPKGQEVYLSVAEYAERIKSIQQTRKACQYNNDYGDDTHT